MKESSPIKTRKKTSKVEVVVSQSERFDQNKIYLQFSL